MVGFVLHRSVWGFRLNVLGRNARTAQRTGVSVVRAGATALMIGGAMAGLAGAVMLAGGTANYRYTPGFANNVGWEGLLVALVARNRPLVCIPVALLFAALRTGSGFLAATGVERSIVDVVRALLVLALLVPPAVAAIRRRRAVVEASSPTVPSDAQVAPALEGAPV
jgi:simple sugar transport system permease protein